MKKLIMYSAVQNKIGGVEKFNINFCKRMSKYFDITFVCDGGDKESLDKVRKYATVFIHNGREIEGDICLYSTSWGDIKETQIKAKKYIQITHADLTQYKMSNYFNYKRRYNVTHHVSVGNNVAEALKTEYGHKSTVIYNLLDNEIKFKRSKKETKTDVLKLITLSRISPEKGFERMIRLCEILRKKHKKFTWDVYGNNLDDDYTRKIIKEMNYFEEVTFKGVKLDLTQEVRDADYLVQLSNTEGMPYSPREALQAGTPCILTNYPAAYEIIDDGVNGFIVDMGLSNLDFDKLYNEIPNNFLYVEESDEKDWLSILKINERERVLVRTVALYKDKQKGRNMDPKFEKDRYEKLERGLQLIDTGWCEFVV